jgi:hypothetical protein
VTNQLSIGKEDLRTIAQEMANLMLFSFFCLVFILPSLPRSGAIGKFWRKQKPKPKPTLLPPVSKNPEFYRSELINFFKKL